MTRETHGRAVKFHAKTSKQACGLGGLRLLGSGPPSRHDFHHSRRREFCCLEPGAGGGKGEGGSQATLVCHGGSQDSFGGTGGPEFLMGDGDTQGGTEPLLLRRCQKINAWVLFFF